MTVNMLLFQSHGFSKSGRQVLTPHSGLEWVVSDSLGWFSLNFLGRSICAVTESLKALSDMGMEDV